MSARDYDSQPTATDEQVAEYRRHSVADAEEYAQLTYGLPRDAMYGSEAHSLFFFKAVLAMAQPEHVVEIGFGAGCSASMLLGLAPGIRRVVSVDLTANPSALAGVTVVQRRHPGRFFFINTDSRQLSATAVAMALGAGPDLMFIDGGHDHDTVASDLRLARALQPTWLLLDDWWPQFGPGVQSAWAQEGAGYELHQQWGNAILFRRPRVEVI